jgi:uncharacterized protein
MNIVAFAMPPQAYINPLAYTADRSADLAAFAFNFVVVDGRMRGLFSFLFGASMLLVIERAESGGRSAASVTFRRQLWLLVFGLVHFYLIWFGDILTLYALVGMIAWFFRRRSIRSLIATGIAFIVLQLLVNGGLAASAHALSAAVSQPGASPELLEQWSGFQNEFGLPTENVIRENLALYLGPWSGIVEHQTTEELWSPFVYSIFLGPETLAYMLFGMAALKSGLLTGAWEDRRYERTALIGFGITVPAYAVLVALLFADGFSVPGVLTWSMAATIPFRPVMVMAYAALFILLTRNGGWLVERIAAAGRAAFTNYLGTSIVMTAVFYGWGLGLYGSLGRAELWLVVIAMWIVMLAWSKPWLDRFAYGPLEWLWRSLARWQVQPMRRRLTA